MLSLATVALLCAVLLPWRADSYQSVFYTDPALSRLSPAPSAYQDIVSAPTTKLIPVSQGKSFMRCVNGLYYPQLIDYQPYASEIQKGLDAALEGLVYIGNKNGNDYVSIEVDVFGIADRVAAEGSDIIVESLRTAAENVCDEESGALLAISQGMSSFHKSSQYCSRCGSKTASKKFGASRICTNEDCNARSYPRLEPAAIMLVESPCKQYTLLGRKPKWALGRYSVLAGFVEVGESVYQTVSREVFEESGVRVDESTVEFVASQPWPFPASFMMGCRAVAEEDVDGDDGLHDARQLPNISFDEKEMFDVRWFHKDEVRGAMDRKEAEIGTSGEDHENSSHAQLVDSQLNFPGRQSLARLLLTQWASE